MDPQLLILIVGFFVLLMMHVPVAFALGICALLSLLSLGDIPATCIVAHRMGAGIASFPLLAIPCFVVAGMLMSEGGMARRLIEFASAVIGNRKAGLAYVCTLACMLFGSISGSAAAAVSSIGGTLIPEMTRRGYSKPFAVALTTTSATTGLVIPPSNIMIVYAVVSGSVSVAAMFLAGVIPGILLGIVIMIAARFGGYVPQVEPAASDASDSLPIGPTTLAAIPSMFLLVVVLVGILTGTFSPTEAAAIAVLYAFILAVVVYREIPLANLPSIAVRSGITSAVIFLLIGTSQAISWVMASQGIPQAIGEAVLSMTENRVALLLLINLLLLIVGAFMDMTPAVLIFTPIFLPMAVALGVDPVHFGIIVIVNLCIGLCTPPVGACLFIGCGISKTPIAAATRPLLPILAAMVVALLIITFVPSLSMWLPTVSGQLEQ